MNNLNLNLTGTSLQRYVLQEFFMANPGKIFTKKETQKKELRNIITLKLK